MRIKRSLQLWPESATVHLFWRCHNREDYLKPESFKTLYMECLDEALNYKEQKQNCKIYAYCSMSNHFHQAVHYKNGSSKLSNFMRYAHGLFGARYNRKNKRSGKVAEGRPKTPLIQRDTSHEMRVHFYIEANPIRAGLNNINNLHLNPYSSYSFFAYGKKTRFTHILSIPDWYIELGRCPKERQIRYRKLFKEYLENNKNESSFHFMKPFIGEIGWIQENMLKLKSNELMSFSDLESIGVFLSRDTS